MLLTEYLEKYGTPLSHVAKQTNTTQMSIYNIVRKGKMPRLELALAIEKMTRGVVTCEELLYYSKQFKHDDQPRRTGRGRKKRELVAQPCVKT